MNSTSTLNCSIWPAVLRMRFTVNLTWHSTTQHRPSLHLFASERTEPAYTINVPNGARVGSKQILACGIMMDCFCARVIVLEPERSTTAWVGIDPVSMACLAELLCPAHRGGHKGLDKPSFLLMAPRRSRDCVFVERKANHRFLCASRSLFRPSSPTLSDRVTEEALHLRASLEVHQAHIVGGRTWLLLSHCYSHPALQYDYTCHRPTSSLSVLPCLPESNTGLVSLSAVGLLYILF